MNQIFTGVFALLIAAAILSRGKKSQKTLFSLNQEKSFSNSSKQELSFVQEINQISSKKHCRIDEGEIKFQLPRSAREKLIFKKELRKLMLGSPNDRLNAMKMANQWKNSESLPFIRRGLKDGDSRVAIAAAEAIASFKGKQIPQKIKKVQIVRPPRNVALMR